MTGREVTSVKYHSDYIICWLIGQTVIIKFSVFLKL